MDRWIHASSSRSRLFGCTVTAANAAYAYAAYAYSSKDATSIWSPTLRAAPVSPANTIHNCKNKVDDFLNVPLCCTTTRK